MHRFTQTLNLLFLSLYLVISTPIFILLACGQYFTWRFKKPLDKGERAYLLFPMVKWEGVWQRPHHLAAHLARENLTIYFSPAPIHHVLNNFGSWWTKRHFYATDTLLVYQPLIFPGERRGKLLRKLNELLILAHLRYIVSEYDLRRLVVYVNDPLSDFMVRKLGEELTVYDIIDDFASFDWAREDAKARERRLLESVNLVFTGTNSLYESRCAFHNNIHYIPCGVDYEHFNQALKRGKLPSDIADIPSPIFGYIGFVNERIDGELLCRMCDAHPEWSVVLVGPIQRNFGLAKFKSALTMVVMTPDQPEFGLKKHPSNMYFLGRKDYAVLPDYLQAFDCCLLPYLVNEATRAIHPVKVLEYLAAGKPVISTEIPDVQKYYKGHVAIAENADQFILAAEEIVAKSELNLEGMKMAKEKSWENMVAKMKEMMEAVLS